LEESEIDTAFLMTIERNNLNVLHQQRIFIYDENKKIIYRSSADFIEPDKKYLDQVIANKEIEFNEDEAEFAGFEIDHTKGHFYVIIGALDETGIKNVDFLRSLLGIIFILSLIVTGFLGWFFASRALSPMVEVIDEVDQITAKNLHKRVKVRDSKDEIAHLAITFNEMLDRLEGTFIMQKNFVSNASHEFRTPLTVMKGQIEVLLMQNRSEDEYIKTLKSINEDINNLSNLLQGLSELAKANADFPNNNFDEIAVVDLLLDARSELIKNKPNYSIELDIHNFTEDEASSAIMGNLALIKSAITNLMDNACKFSPDMKMKVSVDFNTQLIIRFIDNGIGISDEEMNHIFEPFYRGNDTRNISGHGIGLSLVKRIIELHNGTVTVQSKQGEGTIFTVILPTLSNL
jgi:signal transduction histidine kinase